MYISDKIAINWCKNYYVICNIKHLVLAVFAANVKAVQIKLVAL